MHIIIASMSFPLWLRIDHLINLFFIGLLVRSGIQIIGAHPRFYWNDGSNPKKAWLKLTRQKVPENKLYTSMDDEIPITPLLAQPGEDNLGLGRHWHFFSVIFWILNGIVYVALLFGTGEWTRLIPTSWTIFPRAWQTFLTYITFHIPPISDFRPYDPLQQLTYAAVVFLLGPFLIVTGAAQSPAIEGRFPWYVRIFGGRQGARSLHFLGLLAVILFTILHTALILIVRFPDNIRNIVMGTTQASLSLAVLIAIIALILVFGFYAWSSWYSLHHKRGVQNALGALVDPARHAILHRYVSKQHYTRADVTSYFWVNGRPPVGGEYEQLVYNHFKDWHLEVCGLVEHPLHLSLDDLKAIPKQTQITRHNCIQGWTGIAEWGGVLLSELLQVCKPTESAHFLVFTSYQKGRQSVKPELTDALDQTFYEVLDMELANHPQTILAYEMNGEPLPIEHGAPLRLRVETLLGYKMVKYLRSIELVEDYRKIGQGQGGFREDFQYYGRDAEM
jgi:sulfoxide reductase catalytic subunit YedY